MTKQRKMILEIMRTSDEHMSAQEIYEKLTAVLPDTVLATVYNNLNALEAAGEIRRLHFDGTVDRFDKSSCLHAHLVCGKCGKVEDANPDGMVELLENALGVPVDSYELTITTVCDKCKNNI